MTEFARLTELTGFAVDLVDLFDIVSKVDRIDTVDRVDRVDKVDIFDRVHKVDIVDRVHRHCKCGLAPGWSSRADR